MISHDEHRRRLARDAGKTIHIVDRGNALCGNFKEGDLHVPIAQIGSGKAIRDWVAAEKRVGREVCPVCIAKVQDTTKDRGKKLVLGRLV